MARDRDPDKGQYQPEHTDQQFLDAVSELETDDTLPSTGDVANHVGCSRETARRWLTDLADQGDLRKLDVGNAFAWTTR